MECTGFDMLENPHTAESSKARKVKKWLEDYRRKQYMQQGLQLEATQEQAMSQTDVRPWKRGHKDTSDTNKCQCFQSTLDTHGNFDKCDEAQANTITAAITAFLVGCAITFSIVESSFFAWGPYPQSMVTQSRPFGLHFWLWLGGHSPGCRAIKIYESFKEDQISTCPWVLSCLKTINVNLWIWTKNTCVIMAGKLPVISFPLDSMMSGGLNVKF
jgi:hypothetical protein